MMRFFRWCCLALLLGTLATAAHAQTCPPQSSPTFPNPTGSVFGAIASTWKQYFAAKVDANGGTLCNPVFSGAIVGGTFTNPTINGGTITGTTVVNLASPLGASSGGTGSTSIGPEFTTTGGSGNRFDIVGGGITSSMLASGAAAANLGSGTANQIFAAPDRSSGTGSFRAMVFGDLPTGTANAVMATNGSGAWSAMTTIPAAVQGNITALGALTSEVTTSDATDSTNPTTGAFVASAGGLGVIGHASIGPTAADWTNPSWIYGPAYGQNPNAARLAVLGEGSAGDNPAILGAVHTLGGHQGIGVVAFGLNDDTAHNNPVYGLYAPSIIADGVGSGTGPGSSAFTEIESISYVTNVTVSAASQPAFEPNNLSAAIWAACGGGVSPGNGTTTGNCSLGLGFVNNTRPFETGIGFDPTSLDAARGAGGGGIAVELARGMDIRWINSAAGVDADIYGNASGLNVTSPVVLPTVSGNPSLTVGSGSLGIAGILVSNGAGSLNFFQATDGTHEMIAGVDGATGAIKMGSLSDHTLSIVANNSTVISVFADGGVTVGSPTGGDKGAGTINVAGGLYLNGTAYTNP